MGEAIVQPLRGSGATVVTTARSTSHDLAQPDLFAAADISTAEGAEKVVSYVLDRLGGVDMLVNNVGGSSAPGGGFAALTDEEWQYALNSNLLATVRLDRGLLLSMVEQGAGVIIHSKSQLRLEAGEATYFDVTGNSTPDSMPLPYAFDYAGDEARHHISVLQLQPALNIHLPQAWFVELYPSPDIRINFLDHNKLFLPLDVLVGKLVTPKFIASLEVSAPIVKDYDLYHFKLEARIGFFF
jgi:hypothetical protein